MDATDCLVRGMKVIPTGQPILMPPGKTQLEGRLLSVTGAAIDGIGNVDKTNGVPIHREPPKFEDLSTESEILFNWY